MDRIQQPYTDAIHQSKWRITQVRDEAARANQVYNNAFSQLWEHVEGFAPRMAHLEAQSIAASIPQITSNNEDFQWYEDRLTNVERTLEILNYVDTK